MDKQPKLMNYSRMKGVYDAHLGDVVEELFDLARIDVFTATDNHVLDTARDTVETVLVLHTKVTGMQEAVLRIRRTLCCPRKRKRHRLGQEGRRRL